MADVYGLCGICGRPAGHRCRMCGKAVCSEHFYSGLGICSACKKGLGAQNKQ